MALPSSSRLYPPMDDPPSMNYIPHQPELDTKFNLTLLYQKLDMNFVDADTEARQEWGLSISELTVRHNFHHVLREINAFLELDDITEKHIVKVQKVIAQITHYQAITRKYFATRDSIPKFLHGQKLKEELAAYHKLRSELDTKVSELHKLDRSITKLDRRASLLTDLSNAASLCDESDDEYHFD